MAPFEYSGSERACILIADDEPDVHAVSRLSLKGLKVRDKPVELLFALSGAEAVEMVRTRPEIAVILLDVVMENDHAGLTACRAIREDLKNPFVRILLRTGQPGVAPERQAIDDYDIDGYLPKAEVTSNRVYSSVRTALRAHGQLVELERHRRHLAAVSDCAMALHSFAPLAETLQRVLSTVVELWPAPLAVLELNTFEAEGNPQRYIVHRSTEADPLRSRVAVERIQADLARAAATLPSHEPAAFADGYLVPLILHRELGRGYIFIQRSNPDELTRTVLPLLAAHAANALYSSVAQAMLNARQGPLFDAMAV